MKLDSVGIYQTRNLRLFTIVKGFLEYSKKPSFHMKKLICHIK